MAPRAFDITDMRSPWPRAAFFFEWRLAPSINTTDDTEYAIRDMALTDNGHSRHLPFSTRFISAIVVLSDARIMQASFEDHILTF